MFTFAVALTVLVNFFLSGALILPKLTMRKRFALSIIYMIFLIILAITCLGQSALPDYSETQQNILWFLGIFNSSFWGAQITNAINLKREMSKNPLTDVTKLLENEYRDCRLYFPKGDKNVGVARVLDALKQFSSHGYSFKVLDDSTKKLINEILPQYIQLYKHYKKVLKKNNGDVELYESKMIECSNGILANIENTRKQQEIAEKDKVALNDLTQYPSFEAEATSLSIMLEIQNNAEFHDLPCLGDTNVNENNDSADNETRMMF